jgi:hypothetical protein
MNSAVGVLTAIFTNEIERRIPVADHAAIEAYITGNEIEPKYFVARGIRMFLNQAILQKELGAVDEFHYQYMLSEIIGAIRGIPSNERMANRVVAPLLSGLAKSEG